MPSEQRSVMKAWRFAAAIRSIAAHITGHHPKLTGTGQPPRRPRRLQALGSALTQPFGELRASIKPASRLESAALKTAPPVDCQLFNVTSPHSPASSRIVQSGAKMDRLAPLREDPSPRLGKAAPETQVRFPGCAASV